MRCYCPLLCFIAITKESRVIGKRVLAAIEGSSRPMRERSPVTAAGLQVQLLGSPAEMSALARECDELAGSMRPRVPFATSTWLALWWRHYSEHRLLVNDRFFVHTLRDASGRLCALAPLMLSERPGTGPLRARTLAFFGGDKSITELRGMICAPDLEGPAVRQPRRSMGLVYLERRAPGHRSPPSLGFSPKFSLDARHDRLRLAAPWQLG